MGTLFKPQYRGADGKMHDLTICADYNSFGKPLATTDDISIFVKKVNDISPTSGNVTLYSKDILYASGGTSTVKSQIDSAASTANSAYTTAAEAHSMANWARMEVDNLSNETLHKTYADNYFQLPEKSTQGTTYTLATTADISSNIINGSGNYSLQQILDDTSQSEHKAGATGDYAFSGNGNSTASGKRATAFGTNTLASGAHAFVCGDNCEGTAPDTFVANNNNKATEIGASAFGFSCEANADNAFACGGYCKANGKYSFAGGDHSTTNEGTTGAFVYGQWLTSNNTYQTVFGTYNQPVSDAKFIIGNGTDWDKRSNAFEVYDEKIALKVPLIASDSVGTQGQFLQSNGNSTAPTWADAPTGTVVANPTLTGNEPMLKSVNIGGNLYNTEYIKEISTQYIRITDLDTGIYKLTYNGSKRIRYNGSTNTDYISALGDNIILAINKYSSTQTYWTWSFVESSGRAQLYKGETNTSTGNYIQCDYIVDTSYYNKINPYVITNGTKDTTHTIILSEIIENNYDSKGVYEIYAHARMYSSSECYLFIYSDKFGSGDTSNYEFNALRTSNYARNPNTYLTIPATGYINYMIRNNTPTNMSIVIYGYRRIS